MPVFITQMQAKFNIDAPSDLFNCDPDDIYLNVSLVSTGDVTVEISPNSDLDYAAAVLAIESGTKTWLGTRGFGSKGGFEINNGTVKIISPDGGGEGSIVTVTSRAELCIDAFKHIRDVMAEFAADPVGFVQARRQLGHSDTFYVDTL